MGQRLWRRRDLLFTIAGAAFSQAIQGLRPIPSRAANRAWNNASIQALRRQLRGELLRPSLPWYQATAKVLAKLQNPFWIQEQPGGLQSTGWLGGWTASSSRWAIAATCAEDLAAGVNFARENNLRLVVKGAGHDYLGRNCAPDSLLLWTHRMRQIMVHDAFLPEGSPTGTKAEWPRVGRSLHVFAFPRRTRMESTTPRGKTRPTETRSERKQERKTTQSRRSTMRRPHQQRQTRQVLPRRRCQ